MQANDYQPSCVLGARKVPPIPVYSKTPESRQALLQYLISAGAQAPSWYNCQPWGFSIENNAIEVYLKPNIDKTIYNWNEANSMLACGAATENIVVAAEARGLDPLCEIYPDATKPLLMAKVHINFDKLFANVTGGLEASVWLRHTNTLEYKDDVLSQAYQNTLTELLHDYPGTKLSFLTDKIDKNKVFQAVSRAEFIRFSRQDLHKQLYKMIRWNDAESIAQKTGHPLASLGACGFGEFFFRATKSWHVMQILNIFGAAENQAKRASSALMHSSAIGLLTIKKGDTKAILQGGRALQKVWLKVSQLGFDLQPHNATLMFDFALRNGGKHQFNDLEKIRIEDSIQILGDVFSTADLTHAETGVFLFRIGRGETVHGYTFREVPKLKR